MEQTDVSVIFAIDEPPAMLPVALAHLDAQSFPAGRFEIVVAAHGAATASLSKIEQFAAGLPVRIRCVALDSHNRAAALNRAIDEAGGTWLLFLDHELLAGSHLVERHVAAQERRGGDAAVVGAIQRHPQSHEGCYTKWGHLQEAKSWGASRPLNAMHWRAWNLSLPRRAVVEAGGFDEGYKAGGLIDVDLAWRLSRKGLPGYFQHNASAYALRGVELFAEQHRIYLEGYSLARLETRTGAAEVVRHFLQGPAHQGPWSRLLPAPMAVRTCHVVGQQTRMFARLFPKVLHYRLLQGYRDAQAGRPPRAYTPSPEKIEDAVAPRMQTLH